MCKKFFCVWLMAGMMVGAGYSQSKYCIYFTDKDGVSFDPYEYFDGKAIQRRKLHGIPLSHYTDWPVKEVYLEQVAGSVIEVKQISRWFNASIVIATEQQIAKINQLPFVKEVERMSGRAVLAEYAVEYEVNMGADERDLLRKQTGRLGAKAFADRGLDGTGIRVAIFDAGFPTVDINPAFQHILKANRVINTWDFVKNKEDVYAHASHGTMVMSCIGGMAGEEKIGLATGAEFLLARTEISKREPFSEEENWLAAAEWADKHGAHIINSSLAYTFHRYFNTQMDGKTSFVARAANMAASKGILVVNAAGNDGSKQWKTIGSPGDADSVLTVGGISPHGNYHISFSSFGPTADKRMKPNVCAFGHALAAGKSGFSKVDGTSFASPLVAGFAACALQSNPRLKNMELFREIERSGDLYPYFDYAHGFGVPRAKYFVGGTDDPEPTFSFEESQFILKVVLNDDFDTNADSMDIEEIIENMIDSVADNIKNVNWETNGLDYQTNEEDTQYLYYHIENNKGYLDKYYVIDVYKKIPVKLYVDDYKPGQKLRVHYKGYTKTHIF